MKLISGGLRPGEKPKYRPKTGTLIVPSFNLALSADGRIMLTLARRPTLGDKSTSTRQEHQLMPGKQVAWVVRYQGAQYTITIEREPSDTINLVQAKRARETQP